MELRLWLMWEPADGGGTSGYHLEVDRPYARVPITGERIRLIRTRYGVGQLEIEGVEWDDELPNLHLGIWAENDGFELARIVEMGFHQTTDQVAQCKFCSIALAKGQGDTE